MTDFTESGFAEVAPEGPTDAELLVLSRDGDVAAYAELYSRYRQGAVRYAAATSSKVDPEDVAAEAFARVWSAIRNGGGPTEAFRPYLYQTVRNVALNVATRSREVPTEPGIVETTSDLSTVQFDEVAVGLVETEHVAAAFASLPERWQQVLWMTEVDGLSAAEVASSLGVGANAASALAMRAREGLRTAWLQAQIQPAGGKPDCEWTAAHMGAFVRDRATAAQRERVQHHLDTCSECSETRHKAALICASLKTVAAIGAISAVGATAYAAAAVAGAAGGAVHAAPLLLAPFRWLDRARQAVQTSLASSTATGGVAIAVTAAAIVGGIALVAIPAFAGATADNKDSLAALGAPANGSGAGAGATNPGSTNPGSTDPGSAVTPGQVVPGSTPTALESELPSADAVPSNEASQPNAGQVAEQGRSSTASARPTTHTTKPTPTPSRTTKASTKPTTSATPTPTPTPTATAPLTPTPPSTSWPQPSSTPTTTFPAQPTSPPSSAKPTSTSWPWPWPSTTPVPTSWPWPYPSNSPTPTACPTLPSTTALPTSSTSLKPSYVATDGSDWVNIDGASDPLCPPPTPTPTAGPTGSWPTPTQTAFDPVPCTPGNSHGNGGGNAWGQCKTPTPTTTAE